MSESDQTLSDRDQTASDGDQTASDNDQTASESDSASSRRDQRASDRDQDASNRAFAKEDIHTAALRAAQGQSRDERQRATDDRRKANEQRQRSGDLRAAERVRAAADRRRAAAERAEAAQERARLQAELATSHLDDLTGAYRRAMGDLVLSNEIARARRADGRFVIGFVDVDGLKRFNDREGHQAGDRALRTVVGTIRSCVRSFDPIVRYGGDEFVCGLSGTDVEEVRRRFDAIERMLLVESVGISVGLAALQDGETREQLIARADSALLEAKAQRRR